MRGGTLEDVNFDADLERGRVVDKCFSRSGASLDRARDRVEAF